MISKTTATADNSCFNIREIDTALGEEESRLKAEEWKYLKISSPYVKALFK